MSALDNLDNPDAAEWEPIIQAARAVRANAYAPYSQFSVGAAILCEDGSLVIGCNVENASFGATICAERNAVAQAIAQGKRGFVACAVVAPILKRVGGASIATVEPVPPCGMCRQVLAEFTVDMPVLMVGAEGNVRRVARLSALLPFAFRGSAIDGRIETATGKAR